MSLGRQDRAGPRIPGRRLCAEIGPSFEIVECIDDATAELAVRRTGAVGPVLFKRAAGQTEESCCLGRAQISLQQGPIEIGHSESSAIVWSAGEFGGASLATFAENWDGGGCRRWRGLFSAPPGQW